VCASLCARLHIRERRPRREEPARALKPAHEELLAAIKKALEASLHVRAGRFVCMGHVPEGFSVSVVLLFLDHWLADDHEHHTAWVPERPELAGFLGKVIV